MRAFTLVEILMAMTLMSLIVLALMTVFNSTQTAFRAGLTQTDVLESGRATMDLIKSDLETMTPSLGYSNLAVNFCITTNSISGVSYSPYSPLYQSLPAVNNPNTPQRTNVLESFFILSRGNVNGGDSWIGTGYAVLATNLQNDLYPLYRFTTNYPIMAADPIQLFYTNALNNLSNNFLNFLASPMNNGSHLMDGVVHLRVQAFDINGVLINTNRANITTNLLAGVPGEVGVWFYSNAVPASVEIEMGVFEDSTLQHAEGLPNLPPVYAQSNYLSNHVGQVHIFRQRIRIRNVDPTAYQ
jgi:type II secretory pathway pseudopilin PulG